MSEIAISVKNLSKIYKLYEKPTDRMKEALSISRKNYHKNYYALNKIDFEIKKGETIGIIGSNGAGKSTLLKIITGVLNPSKGDVIVRGKISALLELGAGFNPEYTGIENIYLNGTMMGYTKEEVDSRLQDILQFADIGEFINQPVKTYSSGMFARLAFAVATNVDPEILIVDEALSVGDTKFQIKCMDKMKQMMEGGTTVLFVSHDINSIRRFCKKALWLRNGNLISFGEVNSICDKYMDYLKFGEVIETENCESPHEDLPDFIHGENIAEIIKFKLMDSFNNEKSNFLFNEIVKIEIVYDVYDENISNPVIGVALLSVDDDYVCGLNTLLDGIQVPWKYGRNRMIINYPEGLLALGGNYYFDTAIFDQTATIPIQYIKMVKRINIISNYVGEGRYIIPHEWIGAYSE